MLAWYARGASTDFVRDGDLAAIAAPADFLGINYYETKVVAHDPAEPYHQAREIRYAGRDATAGGLDPRPAGLGRILRRVHDHYTTQPLYITENGAAYNDYAAPGRPGKRPRARRLPQRPLHRGRRRHRRGHRPARLLHLGPDRQLRVGRRVQPPLRHRPRRLRHANPHSQSQRPVVPGPHAPGTAQAAAPPPPAQ